MTRTRVWLWRWRRNPLRRPSDVLEAWLVLATAAALLVLMPLAALLAADLLNGPLQRTARQESGERHRTAAVLLENPSWQSGGADVYNHAYARVRWTAPDGTSRTARARVDTDHRAGTVTSIWTDRQGHLSKEPLSPDQARIRAIGGGIGIGAGVGALVVITRLVLGRVLMRGRMAAWDVALAELDERGKHDTR
jgi:hypothetical protein